MKAKFIYENINFERGVDPKRSLDIGRKRFDKYYKQKVSLENEEESTNLIYNLLPLILGKDEIPEDIFSRDLKFVLNKEYFSIIRRYVDEYIFPHSLWLDSLKAKLLGAGFIKPK